MQKSRRQAIQAIAAITAATLSAQHQHSGAALVQLATPKKPKFFSPDEMKTLAILVDLIIPRTDTPGASDAGVPLIIDNLVAGRVSRQDRWREGLKWFETESARAAADPTAILQQAMESGRPFFTLLKDATVDAYYSTREGLVRELGWNANTYLREFKGCTHKEHQV